MDQLNIYILNTTLVKRHLSFIYSFVDEKRREKAERYAHEKDRLLSFGAGYLLKKYLPKGENKEMENGKPYLEDGPFFNISHSGEYVVLAIHPTKEVGIDIEKIDSNRVDAIRFVLNEDEKKTNDTTTLFQIWSNKESLAKCISTGLKDMKNISGFPLEGNRTINEENYYSKSMIYDNYSLSVSLKGKEPFDININRVEEIKQ